MQSFLSIITATMLFSLQATALEDKNANKVRQKPRLLNDILPELTQIIDLTHTSRFSSKQLTEQQKYIFLRTLATSINPFMDLHKTKPVFKTKTKSKSFPASRLKNGRILYFRIDSFTSENIKPFIATTQRAVSKKQMPDGIILDLRKCSGFNNENMLKVSERSKVLKLTTICLTGEKTSGAAELMAQAIVSLPRGIIMGSSTAGQPFRHKTIKLKSGFFLLIPQIPPFLKKLPHKPVKPTIYSKDANACMNTAIDLLSVAKKIKY